MWTTNLDTNARASLEGIVELVQLGKQWQRTPALALRQNLTSVSIEKGCNNSRIV
jgi:hypothetical protein